MARAGRSADGAWAEFAGPGAGPVPADRALVVFVRHGERIDEAARDDSDAKKAWRDMIKEGCAPVDPPLTEAGVEQARVAATGLVEEFRGLDVSVFASCSARTLLTAAKVAEALRVPVRPEYGLYMCCADGQLEGLQNFKVRQREDRELRRVEAAAPLAVWPPPGDPAVFKKREKRRRAFLDTVRRLALDHLGKAMIVVVHREAFIQPMRLSGGLPGIGERARVPYCGVGRFLLDPKLEVSNARAWQGCAPGGWAPRMDVGPAPLVRAESSHSSQGLELEPATPPGVPSSLLAEALESGIGWVVLCGGADAEVVFMRERQDGRAQEQSISVPVGEVVLLLSQVEHDDDGVDCVLVRCRGSKQGWARVQDMSLPDVLMGGACATVQAVGVGVSACLRSSPEIDAQEVNGYGEVANGTEVEILALRNTYVKVLLPSGQEGWLEELQLSRDAAPADDAFDAAVDVPTCSAGISHSPPSRVIICRTDGIDVTKMWATPGQRGAWVKGAGGSVSNGELVTVVSQPQPTEKEGTFIQIRRTSGQEGWMKLKNVHRPVDGDEVALQQVVTGAMLLHCRTGGLSTGVWPQLGRGRGQWVESVRNGEKMRARGEPQASDSEGFFVPVAVLRSGVEGWMKLKNLHLPRCFVGM